MNRRDLLKGLAAAGVVLPAVGNVEAANEVGKEILSDSWEPKPIIGKTVKGGSITIDLDKARHVTLETDTTPDTMYLGTHIMKQRIDKRITVELFFEDPSHRDFVHGLHGMNDVVCISKEWGAKFNCSSERAEIHAPGMHEDALLTLLLRVESEEVWKP